MYRHPIGRLSRGAVLDVGLKCTHSCKFCYYSYLDRSDDQFRGMRRAAFRSLDDCKEILRRLKEQGFLNFDFTGGEPSLHPSIIEITRYAHQDLGLKGRMITLGQFLMKRMPHCRRERLIDDLLDAGLINFLLSVHAVEPDLFHRITGEAWAPLLSAMEYLDAKGFQYCTNTTVFAWNYEHLPAIARELLRHRVYLHNFIIMNAYYEWNRDGQAFGVQAKYADVLPYLREAVGILESGDVGVNIRYAPLCGVRGLEKHLVGMVGVRYDPYEWMNQAGHFGGSPAACAAKIPVREGDIEPSLTERPLQLRHENGTEIIAMRGQHVKHFAAACRSCAARYVCDGIDANYLKLYGAEEFVPYAGSAWSTPVHQHRAQYGVPFLVKTEPYEDMQAAVRAAYTAAEPTVPLIMPVRKSAQSPRVSVVVTCYNYARYLPESVGSVLAQTYRNFELILVDDGSTDESRTVAERLQQAHPDQPIRVISQANSGQPALARNRGIADARGAYILCLDADDRIAPTMLEECVALLDADPSISIAYTDRRDFDGVDQVVLAGEYDLAKLKHANHLSYCALYRKAAWSDVGGYRDNVRGCEDWDFWVAAGAHGHYGRRIPKPLFWYRRHDTGVYQDVIKNFERLSAQIVLNNCKVYEPEAIRRAEALLADKPDNTAARSKALVSVIIPTYNRPDRLRKALSSVLAQSYSHIEIIVINDGGVEVEALLTQLDRTGRITYLRKAVNGERSAARNLGLRIAQGTYIAYLDDDDWYEPHHIDRLVAALETGGKQVVYGDAKRIHEVRNGDAYVSVKTDVPYSFDFDRRSLLVTNYIPMLCLMHHRSCLDVVGLFDESLSTHEDWEFLIRLSRRYDFMHVADVTCAFTWREDGTSTTSGKSEDFLKTAAAVHQRYAAESSRDPGVADAQRRFLEQLRTRSQKAGPLCSIIIPVWNKAELTRQCLTKLADATRGIDYEVVIVDNGSTDETPAFLRRLSGDVRIVTNTENRGFAKACNQGAALAKGRYLVFLNNDTIPLPGWLNALVDEVETHAEVAVVGSQLLYEDGTVQHAGVAFSWTWSTPYHLYRGVSRQAPMVNRRRELQAVTGACMLIRKERFEAVGGFDEDYRNGFEDIDLCLKVQERGGRIVYQPKSVLYHLESQTSGRKDHDRANAKRLCDRWGHKWWLADEYMIYAEDGLAWRGRKENGTWRHSLERFSDQQDQARWERVSRVQALTHRGDAADLPALKHLLADVDEWPNDQQVLHWAAAVCKRLNESASEEAFWKRALIIEEVPDGRAALARLALEHGRFDEAGEHLRVLMADHPRHGEGWLIQGVLAMQRHAYEEAASAFEAALQNGADFRKSRLGCGMAEMGQGLADRAWNRFTEILTAHADDAETLHWLLRAGTALERWEELARLVGRYTKRNPADLSARFALAGVYVRLGRRDAAQREYEAVRLLNPAYEGLDQLAHALAGTEACSTSYGH